MLRVILHRLKAKAEELLAVEQTGVGPGPSTVEQTGVGPGRSTVAQTGVGPGRSTVEQTGVGPGRSTVEQIFNSRVILEKQLQHQRHLFSHLIRGNRQH